MLLGGVGRRQRRGRQGVVARGRLLLLPAGRVVEVEVVVVQCRGGGEGDRHGGRSE